MHFLNECISANKLIHAQGDLEGEAGLGAEQRAQYSRSHKR